MLACFIFPVFREIIIFSPVLAAAFIGVRNCISLPWGGCIFNYRHKTKLCGNEALPQRLVSENRWGPLKLPTSRANLLFSSKQQFVFLGVRPHHPGHDPGWTPCCRSPESRRCPGCGSAGSAGSHCGSLAPASCSAAPPPCTR